MNRIVLKTIIILAILTSLITINGLSAVETYNDYPVMSDIPERPDFAYDKEVKQLTMAANLPDYFSWKDNDGDWTTPVRNQYACGSCWAFAALAAIESQINIVNNNPDLDVDLSEQYVLSCLPSAGNCLGGLADLAFYYIRNTGPNGNYVNGIIPETCMPYEASSSISCFSKCPDWLNQIYPIEDYGFMYGELSRNTIKSYLIEKGPMVAHLQQTYAFNNYFYTHHSPDHYYVGDDYYTVDHAVLLVGYKDDPNIPNGGYWICKNSHGPYYGYSGFFNLAYGSLGIGRYISWVELPSNGEPPVADFSYSPEYPSETDIVSFNDQSTDTDGTVENYWWDFGDGYFSDLKNPVHCYYYEGIFDVELKVTDNSGLADTITKTINLGELDPVAFATASDDEKVDDDDNGFELFTFDGIDSYDPDGTIISYEWTEGSTVLSNSISFTDDFSIGEHTVILTVTDNDGNYDSDSVTINVLEKPPNIPPVANANADQTVTDLDGNGFETILLDGSNSYDIDGEIISYEWGYNSNVIGNSEIIAYAFPIGVHDVTLTVADDEDTDSDIVTITVNEKPTIVEIWSDDFSTGDFSKWTYYPYGSSGWKVISQEAVSERACSKIYKSLDLSGYGSVNISFDKSITGNLESDDYLECRIYKNYWNKKTLGKWSGGDSPGWTNEKYEVPLDYLTSGFKIEFYSDTDWVFEKTYIDNVFIEGTPK